ncbi:MAG: hypothetical protein HWN81_04600 [Candidatus Lokiarchaeota archaeon]|nr:hypothetical protein [Candidatus Lokiarchaeota archaeon]
MENSPANISTTKEAEMIDLSQLDSEEFIKVFKDRPSSLNHHKPKKKVKKYLLPRKEFSKDNFLEEFKDERKRNSVYKETHFTNSGNSIHSNALNNNINRRKKNSKKKKSSKEKKEKDIRRKQKEVFKPLMRKIFF